MMKIIFIHDFCFFETADRDIYTAVGLPEQYFDRFFSVGISEVQLVSRKKKQTEEIAIASGFTKINNPNIVLKNSSAPNYSSIFSIKYLLTSIKLLRKVDFCVVSLPSILGIYYLLINFFLHTPYSIEVAGDDDMFSSKKGGWIVTLFIKLLMKHFIFKAKGAAYVTKFLKHKFPNPNFAIISSNVNIPNIIYRGRRNSPLKCEDKIKFAFSGGLVRRKGIDCIFFAVKKMTDTGYKNIEVHFFGGHAEENWLELCNELKITEYCIFRGVLPQNIILSELENMDIYLQPSLSEGLPRATIEAMSRGLPVIATKLPGFKEILPKRFLIYPNDVNELVKKSILLMEDVGIWNNASIRNSIVSERFLFKKLNEIRTEYYKSMIVESKGDIL